MKISTSQKIFLTSILALSLLNGCSSKKEPAAPVGVANPASTYCAKKGGKIEIVKDESGEKGMCHLPDGSVMEEWELFRRDNSPK
jgi:putative hemolysin